MAIGVVVEKGRMAYVYDESGRQLCTKDIGSNGGLVGYTGSSFAIRKDRVIYVYDQQGKQLFTTNANQL